MLYSKSNPNRNYDPPPECKKLPVNARRPFVRARSVRQRKTSRTSSVKSSEEDERNTVITSVDKKPCIEEEEHEIPKEIREEKENQGVNIGTESSEDDEKNKGVQWTEDDEKNLMDLDLSETERNKRLESLIARRRARKMWSIQIRKTLLLNKEISSLIIPPTPPIPMPIAILKHKPFDGSGGSGSGEVSPTPGSAPPVLLPTHDPFDLPYDPFEEKPILTGGSFHESFCLGDTVARRRNSDVLDNCNRLEEKDIDKIVEQVESSNFKKSEADQSTTKENRGSETGTVMVNDDHDDDIAEENRDIEEVETKSVVVENPNDRSSSTTSSDEDEPPFLRVDKEAILKSLTYPHPRSFSQNRDDHTTSNQMGLIEQNRYDAAMMDKVIRHRPTYSIASDMQVEVSEIGSPPETIDGSFSSFDIGSPIEEEDIRYGNEPPWEVSSSQIPVDNEDKSALQEIYRLHDEYTIKHGTSRCKQSNDSVEIRDMVRNMEEQGVSGSFTRPDDSPDDHTENRDGSQISTPESSHTFIPGISDYSDVENAEKLTETGTVCHFESDCDEISEEPLHLSTSPQLSFEGYESSSLDVANNMSNDPQKHLSPRNTLANSEEKVDTKTEPSIDKDERQNATMEDPKNAASSSTSPITKETLQETMTESNPSTLDIKDDHQQDSMHH